MKVCTLVAGILALGLLVGVVTGMGQVTQGSTAVFSVPALTRLSLSTATIDFGTLTQADFDLGYKEMTDAQGIAIWSNKAWTLTVKADALTWTGPWAKPSTDLQWAAMTSDGRVSFYDDTCTPLSTAAVIVAAGTKGDNIQLTMSFWAFVDWEADLPGDYSLGFTYTLTAP